MGHDDVDPIADKPLQDSISAGDEVAFLLCGSGDARHLLGTIIDLFKWKHSPSRSKGSQPGSVHFTIVDINAAALARTVVLFDMILRYGYMKFKKMPRIEDALTVMAYAFSSAVIPPFVLDKMMEHIKSLADQLEDDADLPASSVMGTLYLPKETRVQVLHKLKQWAQPLGDEWAPESLRTHLKTALSNDRAALDAPDFYPASKKKPPSQCEQECNALGVIFPEQPFLTRREPELIPLLEDFRAKKLKAKTALGKHIDSHWKTNPLVIDLDSEQEKAGTGHATLRGEQFASLVWHPADLLPQMVNAVGVNTENLGVIEGLSSTFDLIAASLLHIMDTIQIEVIAGEMADVLERMQHGLLEHRSYKPQDPKEVDPTLFPKRYDRIHMSNIPDYIGGPLTAHMCGGPLLRSDRSTSNLRFNNLLNPPNFKNHDQFLAEYMLMHKPQQIADHFGLVREKPAPLSRDEQEKTKFFEMMGFGGLLQEDYFIWERAGTPERIPAKRMMKRPQLEHWLHSHLLKICLPYVRPSVSASPQYAPLNLTAFFRLVAHMAKLGYPAHQLSGILSAVSEGSIITRARSPRALVLTPQDAAKEYPPRKIGLGPWKAEFTTLLSIWSRVLPFGVVVPPRALVPLDEILEYSVTFPPLPHRPDRCPNIAVVFYNKTLIEHLMEYPEFPQIIQDDETGDASEPGRQFRDKGCHMVTATKYVTATRTATMWLRKDVADEVISGKDWSVCLLRTDTWDLIRPVEIAAAEAVRPVGAWTGNVEH